MQVKRIDFNDDGSPEYVTVRLSRDEALYIATLIGRQTSETSEGVLSGGSALNHEVYGCLTGSFFNRFYENGVADAKLSR